jgi:hypothetical protein
LYSPAAGGGAAAGSLGGGDAVAQVDQRGIGLLRHFGPQQLPVALQVALSATRMGFGGTTPTAAPALPECFDKRAADTTALRNRALRRRPSFQRLDEPVTKVLRVWFHTADYAANVLYMQLQTALVLQL